MARSLSELLALYLLPFALYVLYLAVRRLYILSLDRWTRKVIGSLSLAGLALMLASLLLTGFFADRHEGAYQPARIDNGRIVPSQIQ